MNSMLFVYWENFRAVTRDLFSFSPTKFAVRGIMECLQMELRDRGREGVICSTADRPLLRADQGLSMGQLARASPSLYVQKREAVTGSPAYFLLPLHRRLFCDLFNGRGNGHVL
ncbi:unnamed protein product [Haemonchus placei]|uniref:Uncharacterized protein n=1 Tax=Haemonchus placei TaxID=6290 RepID=A0A0N4W1T3_HAEPC|nr:unnamed protein product [Haemonchus placei]